MKILILSINYWPEVTGIGPVTTCRAEYLAAAGHEVEVCATFPYYPAWKVAEGYRGKLISTELRKGVRVRRGYAYVPGTVTTIRRILHEASFIAAATLRAFFCKRPDVLLVISPPLGLAVPAILLSRIWRIPYVFDVQDLQPDSASDLGMLSGPVLKILYALERAAYRNARLVTTLTNKMKERIISKGIPAGKVDLIEPRMDESLATIDTEEGAAFRQKYDIGGEFLVTYSGNIGVKQKLDVVVDAAALKRNDSSLLFLVVGNGADRARIERRAAKLALTNLRFLPVLDEIDFRGLLAASDICLVTEQKTASGSAFPSKIVTYLAAGCPVIASVSPESEVARITCESGAGIVADAEDSSALLRAILEMRGLELEELGDRARAYALRRWSAARVLGHLERILAEAAFPMRSFASEETLQ